MTIREALEKQRKNMLGRPGVAGLGVGQRNGVPALVVMLERDDPAIRASLPKSMDGYPVVVEEVGVIRAY